MTPLDIPIKMQSTDITSHMTTLWQGLPLKVSSLMKCQCIQNQLIFQKGQQKEVSHKLECIRCSSSQMRIWTMHLQSNWKLIKDKFKAPIQHNSKTSRLLHNIKMLQKTMFLISHKKEMVPRRQTVNNSYTALSTSGQLEVTITEPKTQPTKTLIYMMKIFNRITNTKFLQQLEKLRRERRSRL